MRQIDNGLMMQTPELAKMGLDTVIIGHAVNYVHQMLDSIDSKMIEGGSDRLSELVELANLSSMIGNLFRSGVCRHSDGKFAANAPHTFPDLRGIGPGCMDVEIKVALETNKPKGHLVKPGPHLTVRYSLADQNGNYQRGKDNRGNVAWIWEVRAGFLKKEHFSVSNTEGDSGKTAVINQAGMAALKPIFFDPKRSPLSPAHANFKYLTELLKKKP